MQRHLAIFLPSLDGGGAEKVVLALAERFVARGVQCDLVIAINKGQLLDQVPNGARLITLGKRKTIHAVFALAHYLRRERPQVMLSTIFASNLTALIASAVTFHSCRVVLREANQTEFDIRGGTGPTWLNRYAATHLYRRADAVIAVAESVGQGLIKAQLAERSRLYVIQNPVPRSCGAQDAIAAPNTARVILACGRLEPQKDHATLLRAFMKVRSRVDASLVILGEGSLLTELQALTCRLGINSAVTFAGYVRNPQDWMRKASLFVHSSRFEGMSNVLIEALACGCPIVATNCPGGTREILADGQFGTLVPVGDELAMAQAMEEILGNKVAFPDASEHLKKFDIEHISNLYLDVLFPFPE